MGYFRKRRALVAISLLLLGTPFSAFSQSQVPPEGVIKGAQSVAEKVKLSEVSNPFDFATVSPALSSYYNVSQGSSIDDLVSRALALNTELAAARLEIERGRARLTQSGLRPNPSIDFEQTTGRFTNAPGEKETSIGVSIPLELGGKRQRRIDLARAELAAAEAVVADRERQLIREIRATHAEALALFRELQVTEGLSSIDTETARVVEARVTEGDASPLELNLIRVEIDRLRSRRALVEGQLQAALIKLKNLSGLQADQPLRLRESLSTALLADPVMSVEEAIQAALKSRPDARLARLIEEVSLAGYRLAQAQSLPDVTAFTRYSVGTSIFDDTPVGVLRDRDKLLTFGVSIGIPLFNRNQGAKAVAEIAIRQAQRRREFVEATVRSEVAAAYARFEAARNSLDLFQRGVIERSARNITAVRTAYQLGAYRVTELLAEQRRLLDSQREYIEALTERYRALAEIQSAVGSPAGSK